MLNYRKGPKCRKGIHGDVESSGLKCFTAFFILMTTTKKKGSIGRKFILPHFKRLIFVFSDGFKEKILTYFKGKDL